MRTGPWMGPPQVKRAPRGGPTSIAILAREGNTTDWKQYHGSHGFHTTSSQCGTIPPFSESLICTVARPKLATYGTSPGTLKRRFASNGRVHTPPERSCAATFRPLPIEKATTYKRFSTQKHSSGHGQNLALTVLCVPNLLNSGLHE